MIMVWMFFIIFALILSIFIFLPFKKRPVFFVLFVFGLSAFGLGLYYFSGSYQQLTAYSVEQKKSQEVKRILKQFKNTQEIIDAMKKAVAKNPNKAKGWYLLGQLYRHENNRINAKDAFQRAYLLKQNFVYTFAYLQSLYQLSDQQSTPVIIELIQKLKKNWPDNPELLDFLGYDAYIHGNYAAAIENWEKLLPYLSDNPKAHQTILLAIGKAEKKLLK